MTSITAVAIVAALLAVVTLIRLADPAMRARHRWPLLVPIAVFVVLSFVSAALAADRVDALRSLRPLYLVALFFIAVNGFDSSAAIRRALRWLFVAVAVASLYAVAQTVICTSSLAVPGWVEWAMKIRLERCRVTGIEPFRAKGFFSIYMTLGGSLVVALALLSGTLALGARPVPSRLAFPAVAGVVALALTYARNAWVGLVAALIVVAGLSRRWLWLAPVAVAAAVAVLAPTPLRAKIVSIFDPSSPSVSERLYFWEAGRRMLRDAPFLGLGPGGVRRHYPAYKDPGARRPGTSHLHNNVVQIAAERGLLGLAAWVAIWVTFIVKGARIFTALPGERRDERALVGGSLAAVVGFLVAGVFEYNFGDSEVIGLVWIVMAFPFVVERELGAA